MFSIQMLCMPSLSKCKSTNEWIFLAGVIGFIDIIQALQTLYKTDLVDNALLLH